MNDYQLTPQEIKFLKDIEAIDENQLKDPKEWQRLARAFRFSTNLIINDYVDKDTKIPADGRHITFWSVFEPFMYMLGTTIELYLKGYLIAKGEKYKDVKSLRHLLEKLRLRCCKYDEEFHNGVLPYITKFYGRVILDSGGLKYPGKRPPGLLFPDYITVMDKLDDMLVSVVKSE